MSLTDYTGEKPQRGVKATFSERFDDFITFFLETFFDEFNEHVTNLNFESTNSTSSTSLTISLDNKVLLVDAGKSYVSGMTLKLAATAEPHKWMIGEVVSYDSGTGDLEMGVRGNSQVGGTFAAWTLSLAQTELPVGQHEVAVYSGNGHGSTNNKIRRYTDTLRNVGTSISYVDSATDGASFTINDAGMYTITCNDTKSAAVSHFGATLNSTELTTAITSVTETDLVLIGVSDTAGRGQMTSTMIYLDVDDVIRPHTDGTCDGTTWTTSFFSVTRGNGGGATGPAGAQGDKSGTRFQYSSNTAVSNPNAGNFKLNSDTTVTPPTFMSIDTLNIDGIDFEAYIATWDVGGTVIIRTNDNEDTSFAMLTITSKTLREVTGDANWYEFGVSQVAGLGASYSFTHQAQCTIEFYAAGGSTGVTTLIGQSADPADPSDGNSVQWVSDGTGTGDPGDVIIKINVGGVVKTITIVDYSLIPEPV